MTRIIEAVNTPADDAAGAPAAPIPIDALPGHLIRRLQQIAVGLFMEETAAHELTPVQFAALSTVCRQPGMDQRSLARRIAFDTSTIAGVIDRLERRGLVARQASAHDRRVRLLEPTPAGLALLAAAEPGMLRAQTRILEPLTPDERQAFVRMLTGLIEANAAAARAPGPES